MQNGKLIDLFRSLDRQELRRMRDCAYSPLFNKNEKVRRLCEVMIDAAHRGFPRGSVGPERLFAALFPDEPFDEKKLSYLASDLLKLGEKFIGLQALEKDGYAAELYRLRACRERGLDKAFRHHFKRVRKALRAKQPVGVNLLLQRHQFSQLAQERFGRSGARAGNPHLQQAADDLDHFYYARKMQLSGIMLSHQLALNERYELRLMPGEQLHALPELPESHLAQLFALAYQLMQSPNDEELLHAYMRQIQARADELADAVKTELFFVAINYCIRQVRAGHRTFTNTLLALYQEGLREGYLLEDGVLSPWNYKNIVKLGLGLGQLDWVESFVDRYTSQLPVEAQTDAYHFNRADISYHRRDYDQALAHLRDTEFTDVHYTLGAKAMLTKIYYEKEETEALLSLLSSFHLYLLRNKQIGQGTKDAYLNFIRLTKRLGKADDPAARERLAAQIRQTKDLSDRTWLLGRVSG